VKIFRAVLILIILGSLLPALASDQATTLTGSSGLRECATCHFQWIETFDKPQAVLLIEKPSEAVEAEAETCLSCHDGSNVDSRKRVWLDHGHQTGFEPPPGMIVPDILPLKDGKIACRTCHTAHAEVGPEDAANTVFLRVPNESSQLCRMCHPDHMPVEGTYDTHPIGEMPWDIPQELIDAGALVQPNQRLIYCQACHTAHGSKEDHLLIMSVQSNDLCLTCHNLRRPGMWHEVQKTAHPDRPVIQSESQFDAIENMGTRLGDENRLICLSCHRMHDGQDGRFMLAMPLEDSAFCIQCHPDQVELMQTKHNPRMFSSGVKNLQGVTIDQAGPCSACHMFHSIAQPPNPSELDPLGICLSCHSSGGVAGKTGALHGQLANTHPLNIPVPDMVSDEVLPLFDDLNDPQSDAVMTCQTCHNLHESNQPGFLRTTPEKLCQTCHSNLVENMVGNPHNPQSVGETWPTTVTVDQECRSCHGQIHNWDENRKMSKCGICHQMHSWDNNMNLWTFTPAAAERISQENVCLTCHNDINWASAEQQPSLKAVMHPRHGIIQTPSNNFVEPSSNRLNCQSCHDPHGRPEIPHLLRISAGSRPVELCYSCHQNDRSLELSMHNQHALGEETDMETCGPCHVAHATAESSPEMLWGIPLSDQGKTNSEKRCMGCHENDTLNKKMSFFEHPEPLLIQGAVQFWLKTTPVFRDFADEIDQITCRTCHLPHGRSTTIEQENSFSGKIEIAHISANKPMLRPNVARELCAKCHGFEAAGFFLYYHYPNKR